MHAYDFPLRILFLQICYFYGRLLSVLPFFSKMLHWINRFHFLVFSHFLLSAVNCNRNSFFGLQQAQTVGVIKSACTRKKFTTSFMLRVETTFGSIYQRFWLFFLKFQELFGFVPFFVGFGTFCVSIDSIFESQAVFANFSSVNMIIYIELILNALISYFCGAQLTRAASITIIELTNALKNEDILEKISQEISQLIENLISLYLRG